MSRYTTIKVPVGATVSVVQGRPKKRAPSRRKRSSPPRDAFGRFKPKRRRAQARDRRGRFK